MSSSKKNNRLEDYLKFNFDAERQKECRDQVAEVEEWIGKGFDCVKNKEIEDTEPVFHLFLNQISLESVGAIQKNHMNKKEVFGNSNKHNNGMFKVPGAIN